MTILFSMTYLITKVKELGKLVSRDDAQQRIADQVRAASFDVHIITIISNGYYSIAADITFADKFETLQILYAEGEYIDLAYYEVESAKLAGCPFGGWVFSII